MKSKFTPFTFFTIIPGLTVLNLSVDIILVVEKKGFRNFELKFNLVLSRVKLTKTKTKTILVLENKINECMRKK